MMRSAMVVLLVRVIGAGSALANPVAFDAMYVDFDPGSYIDSINPAPYTEVDAYIMLEMHASGVDFSTVSFKVNVTPGTSSVTSYESLLPGGVTDGDWEEGITLWSTECMEVWDHPVPLAVVHLLYTGTPGNIIIGDHPDYPRWVIGCDDSVHIYCVLWHGGIAQNSLPGDCEGQPVETASWTVIKSLYR